MARSWELSLLPPSITSALSAQPEMACMTGADPVGVVQGDHENGAWEFAGYKVRCSAFVL